MTTVYINRPWNSSFAFNGSTAYSDARLEQVHKLSRNLVASLDMGCPNVRHAPDYPGYKNCQTPRERYKLWVSAWKDVYREVSALIRQLKSYRRTVRFPRLTAEQQSVFERVNPGLNQPAVVYLRELSERHLSRMQETAQVLLNARYNAKLASAEARRRERSSVDEVKQAA